MKLKIKKKLPLEETNSVSGGSVEGYAAPFGDPEAIDAFNKEQERQQRLDGDRLVEMYSSQGISGGHSQQIVSPEEEHAGHVERSKHQGLKNVMESEKIRTFKVKIKRYPRK